MAARTILIRLFFLCLPALAVFLLLGLPQSAALYSAPLAIVESVQNDKAVLTPGFSGEDDYSAHQTFIARRTNGERKGEKIALENTFTSSGVFDEKIEEGDQIFLSDDSSSVRMTGFRRDRSLITMFVLVLSALAAFGKKHSVMAFISVSVNLVFFFLILKGALREIDLMLMMAAAVLLFAAIPPVLFMGFRKKTAAALASTISSLVLSFGLAALIILLSGYDGIAPECINYSELQTSALSIFWAQLMISGLGAEMDVCVSISSSLQELIDQNPAITRKDLGRSGRRIGLDIMGTMVNVLFFTTIASAIPWILLVARNGIDWLHFYSLYVGVDAARFITAAMGIVLAIPISTGFSVRILAKESAR